MDYNNIATLIGIVASVEEAQDINGTPYTGYMCIVDVERKSGTIDSVVVMAEGEAPKPGAAVIVTGRMQAQKNFNTGRTLVYILAEDLREVVGDFWEYENEVRITGSVGKGTTYRKTPKGKNIADTFIRTQNALYDTNCYIPCICWNEVAQQIQAYKDGDNIRIAGRLQSRKYVKKLPDGMTEERTAYEVSINEIIG